jgi:hypothetical protein
MKSGATRRLGDVWSDLPMTSNRTPRPRRVEVWHPTLASIGELLRQV